MSVETRIRTEFPKNPSSQPNPKIPNRRNSKRFFDKATAAEEAENAKPPRSKRAGAAQNAKNPKKTKK